MRSPFANWDLCYPRTHTGSNLDPHMHTGIMLLQSPYANGDLRHPRIHKGSDQCGKQLFGSTMAVGMAAAAAYVPLQW